MADDLFRQIPERSRDGFRSVARAARTASRFLLDAVLPPLCPITGEPVSEAGNLSAGGWSQLQFIDDPVCAACGAPFAHDYGEGALCGSCLASPPSFDRARAAVTYDDASHKVIVAFKHADRTDFAPMLGSWLARAGAPMATARSILLPVPLHRRRLAERRFNQAAMIAEIAAEKLGCGYDPMALERTRATMPQKELSEDARKRNVSGAFGVRPGAGDLVKGAHIIVVDDVLTTGATISACARALKAAGAGRVDALVAARVVRHGQDAI